MGEILAIVIIVALGLFVLAKMFVIISLILNIFFDFL